MKKVIALIICLVSTSVWANDDFPGRDRYPKVAYIELEDLYKERDNVVVIDARSPYEYETLRIKNALLVPLTLQSKVFEKEMQRIYAENPGKKLVFYCNGHNCMKSYKAARRTTQYVGLKNVYAFDAGIFDWASKYPNEAFLLGEELKDPSKLVSKEDFNKHLMPAEKFIKSATESSAILDIRDRIERDGFYIFSGHETSISLNDKDKEKLNKFMLKVKKDKKTLYIYDMVGKQVRWFQYYVESKGITDYYFMQGGADAFFKVDLKKLLD